MSHSRSIAAVLTGATALASPALSEPQFCDVPNISVTSKNPEHTAWVCSAAQDASALFTACNIPPIAHPVHIKVVDDIIADCLGLYHCGDNSIDVLSPTIMQARGEPDGIFSYLDTPAYFQSVVVHELSHAAAADMPCPFDICRVGAEYVAYSMQIMSLDEAARRLFEQSTNMDQPIAKDELNPLVLLMASDLFAQRVWTHFSAQKAPCEFLGQLISGEVFLDQAIHDLE